jgi:NAD(P)-dependent dehydrogenase (short-subunit alcohol dehydrogenase family)
MLKQEPLPGFEQRGSIVNVGSIASRNATPGLSVYSATKAGVLGLTKTDALDYGGDKIRINMVAPGSTITPMLKYAMGEQYMKQDAAQAPLKRLGIPEDIANVIVFLASPRAAYVTGIMVPVDGGLSLATGPP